MIFINPGLDVARAHYFRIHVQNIMIIQYLSFNNERTIINKFKRTN